MIIEDTRKSFNSPKYVIRIEEKCKESFKLAVFQVWFFLYYSYSKVLFGDNTFNYYIILGHLTFMVIYLLYHTIVKEGFVIRTPLIIVGLFTMITVVSYVNNHSGLEKFLGLIAILLSMHCYQTKPMKQGQAKALWIFIILAIAVFLINTSTDLNDDVVKFNPNAGGFAMALLFMAAYAYRKKKRRAIFLIIEVAAVILQFVYGSRTAFFAIVLFVILDIVYSRIEKKSSVKWVIPIVFMTALAAILFAFLYSTVIYERVGWGNVKIFGKDLFTGRELIWRYTFMSLKDNLLFGVGSHLNQRFVDEGVFELVANAHNQPLAMIGAFGLISFVIFYLGFGYVLSAVYPRRKKAYADHVSFIYMLTILVMSSFDVYFFSEYNWLPIMFVYGLVTAISIKQSESII